MAEKRQLTSQFWGQSMKTSPWRLVTISVLLLLGFGLYYASLQVNYTWRWERLPQYLVITGGEDVAAPFDGTIALKGAGKTATVMITPLLGGAAQSVAGIDVLQVSDGEVVFAGNTLGKKSGYSAGPLLLGLLLTLQISSISLVFALALGLIAGLARVSSNLAARDLSSIYVELIRGTPLLVQLFIVYFFLGTVFHLSAFVAGVVALSVFTGAYIAEIIRAGIESVPRGQAEAARSLGMTSGQTMRYVVLPQALRKTLPPLAGQSINLIKDSSLVSVMALTDLTKAGREVVSSTFSPFEVWFTVAIMYLLLTGSLSMIVRRMERSMAND